jgi:hypothetical protein
MFKYINELAIMINEVQNIANLNWLQYIEKGMVNQLSTARILECPAAINAALFNFEMFIFARGNTPVDLCNAILKL